MQQSDGEMRTIPLVDLSAQYRAIKSEIDEAVLGVLDSASFIGGPRLEAFERAFAQGQGVAHCVGVGNGTDAITLLLRALGVGSGDEVIVPANSFIATSEAVTAAGARVVFADCREDDACIDPREVERVATQKTKAVIVVHLYGQMAEMDRLVAIAKKRNLFLIEDSAQAHCAEYRGKRAGTFGAGATFSFYPGKNLGAYGDAGAVGTNDPAVAESVRMFANHGRKKGEKYDHHIEGMNSRLDALQAAVLEVKMRHIEDWTAKRQSIADEYQERLQGVGDLVLPGLFSERPSVSHLFVVRTKQRDLLREHLRTQGIEAGVHYPIALPFLEAYAHLGHTEKDFPVSARLAKEILSIPIYPELSPEDIDRVVNSIKTFYV